MRVTEQIEAVKVPFTLQLPTGDTIERFVYAYLVFGGDIVLIDCGIAGKEDAIFESVGERGRQVTEIATAVITHAHPDHIGGAKGIKQQTGCSIAAHGRATPWIENIDRQYAERPIPSFYDIVEGSVAVDRVLGDGDRIELGGEDALEVLHTPGHSAGHIALHYPAENALFCGDALPQPGQPPIYDDPAAVIESINKLAAIEGTRIVLSSWDAPIIGRDAVRERMQEGLEYVRGVDRIVKQVVARTGAEPIEAVAVAALKELGVPQIMANPLFVRAVKGHLAEHERN